MTLAARLRSAPMWVRIAGAWVGGALVIWMIWAYRAAGPAGFEEAVTELRDAGYATTPAAWNGPPIPPEDNGAAEIDAADAWLTERLGTEGAWKAIGPWRNDLDAHWWEGATPEQVEELRAFLDAARPYFVAVERASRMPRLRWRQHYATCPAHLANAELPGLRRVALLQAARGRVGRTDAERLESVATRLRLARRVEVPSVVAEIVFLGMASRAAGDISVIVAPGATSASGARAVLEPELSPTWGDRFPDLARSEIVVLADVFRGVYDGRIADASLPRFETPLGRFIAVFLGGPADALRSLRAIAEVPPLPYDDRMRRYDAVMRGTSMLGGIGLWFCRPLLTKATRLDAALRLSRVGLAVAERHERTGAWPASLDDVRDAFPDGMPTDPFTDAPFVYTVTEKTVRIAAAATNKDGEPLSADDLRDGALVWEFPR